MFEAAELGRQVSKKQFKKKRDELRERLLLAQFALQEAGVALFIIFEGIDNQIKADTINLLNQWFDTRDVVVHGFGPKTDEEARRPRFWRYWRTFPAKGKVAIYYGSWYTGELLKRALHDLSKKTFDHHMQKIARLENLLVEDGAVIAKFWLHTSSAYSRRQLKQNKKSYDSNGLTHIDRSIVENMDAYSKAAERMIRRTDRANAPWQIVEAEDENFRSLAVATTLCEMMERRLQSGVVDAPVAPVPNSHQRLVAVDESEEHSTVLDRVDLAQSLEKSAYKEKLKALQSELRVLSWQAYNEGVSVTIVFEGWDAAGKGGAIRRLMKAVDIRIAQVISISAPSDEEKAHHYLWRFWRHVTLPGRFTIYDRSWYGRVLVERVEGFASESEWRRAYAEINEFEEQLYSDNNLVIKFWLHISPEEQLQRFNARAETPYKQHKITDEDWRNRDRWDDYELAVDEMVLRTSTDVAPWHLIPANSKYFARIEVLERIRDHLREALKKS